MAHNIGYCVTNRVSPTHIAKVSIPTEGLVAGNFVLLNDLDSNITNNYEVYSATKPLTENLGEKNFAIIQNGGFETLADGRRPVGQPDFTQYEFNHGDSPATAVFCDPHLRFEIGCTTVTGGTTSDYSDDVGKYIVPANGTYKGAVVDATTAATIGCKVKIVAVKYFPLGGKFGLDFEQTYVCIAE